MPAKIALIFNNVGSPEAFRETCTEEALKELLADFGVSEVNPPNPEGTMSSTAFAIVEKPEEAFDFLNNKQWNGMVIRASIAKSPPEHPHGWAGF